MQMQRSQLDIAPTIAKLLNIEYTADGDPIEEIVEEFTRSGRRSSFFICGDHPVHTDLSEENVALLVFRS
jgi:hypothetical protein